MNSPTSQRRKGHPLLILITCMDWLPCNRYEQTVVRNKVLQSIACPRTPVSPPGCPRQTIRSFVFGFGWPRRSVVWVVERQVGAIKRSFYENLSGSFIRSWIGRFFRVRWSRLHIRWSIIHRGHRTCFVCLDDTQTQGRLGHPVSATQTPALHTSANRSFESPNSFNEIPYLSSSERYKLHILRFGLSR